MAKKAKKKAKKAKLVVTAAHLKDAGAIVAEVMAHFGAGYVTQRQTEGAVPAANDPIFTTHGDFLKFQRHLVGCTSRNIARRTLSVRAWRSPNSALRKQVAITAFQHGELTRREVVTAGTSAIVESQVMATLEVAKRSCPPGPGGAGVCEDTN
jgi:hypothetical protein